MCTQEYDVYTCGCRTKGEFHQCDEKYTAQSNLQCDRITHTINESRNYCAKHLVKEGKAKDEYRGRVTR